MAVSLKTPNILRSGDFPAGGEVPLRYVMLSDGSVLIDRDSLYTYLQIEDVPGILNAGYLPKRIFHKYKLEAEHEKTGFLSLEIPALCVNIIEHNAKTDLYKLQAFNAMMLIMFLSSAGINKFVGASIRKCTYPEAKVILLKK